MLVQAVLPSSTVIMYYPYYLRLRSQENVAKVVGATSSEGFYNKKNKAGHELLFLRATLSSVQTCCPLLQNDEPDVSAQHISWNSIFSL